MGIVGSLAAAVVGGVIVGVKSIFSSPPRRPVAAPPNYRARLQEQLSGFNSDNYNFVVAGDAQVGKSSFINCFVGRQVAQVGRGTETTREMALYKLDPPLRVTITDIPGTSMNHPLSTYVNDFNLPAFDALLYLIPGLPQESDKALIDDLKKFGVTVAVVRSKADADPDYDWDGIRTATSKGLGGVPTFIWSSKKPGYDNIALLEWTASVAQRRR